MRTITQPNKVKLFDLTACESQAVFYRILFCPHRPLDAESHHFTPYKMGGYFQRHDVGKQ